MARRWVQVFSPRDTCFMLDIDYLMSGYGCAWGKGCKGIEGDPVHGCCNHGAQIGDEELDAMKHYVSLLTPEVWEHHGHRWLTTERPKWWSRQTWSAATRLTPDKSTCIFSNSEHFSGGAGCALHHAAIERGDSPIGTKPTACWALPLFLDWDGEMWWLRGLSTSDFGDHHWYCMDPDAEDVEEIAWGNQEPLFQRYDAELRAMIDLEEPEFYDSDILPILQKLWGKTEKVKAGFVPVTIRPRS